MQARVHRPTLQDIAHAAGVSRMTVSLALRNQPSLPAATRTRIRAIARQLGYRPNPLVSALMTQLRQRHPGAGVTIAYVTAFPTRDGWRQRGVFRRAHQGATERAEQLGYRLEEFWLRESGMTGRRLSQILVARGIPAVIIAPLEHPRGHLRLDWSKFALAAIGYSAWRPALHRAVTHHTQSLRVALRELKRRGYRRIGLAISRRFDARADNDWSGAFLAHQQRIPSARRVPPLVTARWTEETFGAWYRQHQPEAVIVGDVRVRDWLRLLGVRVPRDLGLVHLEWSEELRGVAGVRQHAYFAGAAAVDLIVEQLEHGERGIPALPKVVLVEGRWVNGRTVHFQTR